MADTLSFRRAAERCRVSQPSLSAQVAELEGALEVRLFERDRRRVLVTPAGARIIERARVVLREAEDLVDEARRSTDPLAGTLRIGVIPTVSPYLLPGVTEAVRGAFAGLTILWIEDKTDVLVAELDAGELDAALLALEADIGDVQSEVIATDPFVLVTAPGHPLGTQAGPVAAAELRGEDVLVLAEGHCFGDQARAFCSSARARDMEFRATSLPTLVQVVAGGVGVTLLPELALPVEGARAGLCVREFAEPVPGRTIALIWRRRSPVGPALSQLAAVMRDAYPVQARSSSSTKTRRRSRTRNR